MKKNKYKFTVKLEGLSAHVETLECRIRTDHAGIIAVYEPDAQYMSDWNTGLIRIFPAARTIVERIEE